MKTFLIILRFRSDQRTFHSKSLMIGSGPHSPSANNQRNLTQARHIQAQLNQPNWSDNTVRSAKESQSPDRGAVQQPVATPICPWLPPRLTPRIHFRNKHTPWAFLIESTTATYCDCNCDHPLLAANPGGDHGRTKRLSAIDAPFRKVPVSPAASLEPFPSIVVDLHHDISEGFNDMPVHH